VVSGQSQIPMVGSEEILDKLRLNKGINGIESVPYSNINGDPYIYKDFETGKLTVITGEKYDVNVRYDIYANQIHLKTDNVIYAIIHPEKVSLIEAGNLKIIYSDYKKSAEEGTTDGSSYFIVKADGKCKLLIKKNIRIQDAEPAKLYQEAKPAKFILTEDTYYLKPGDKSAVRIKSKNDILNLLSDKKEALDSFITSNKIGVKKIEDLEKIVSHYNGL
jgi:hypothetical protein